MFCVHLKIHSRVNLSQDPKFSVLSTLAMLACDELILLGFLFVPQVLYFFFLTAAIRLVKRVKEDTRTHNNANSERPHN